MDHIYYRIVLFLVMLFVFCPLVFSGEVEGLSEIYNTPIPDEIRRNFDEYIHVHEVYPEAEQLVLDGEKFLDIYTKKFIVIGLEPNSFGGVWAVIAVEGEPWKAFKLWLYDVECDVYDLRSITELAGSFNEDTMQELDSPAYSHFWL